MWCWCCDADVVMLMLWCWGWNADVVMLVLWCWWCYVDVVNLWCWCCDVVMLMLWCCDADVLMLMLWCWRCEADIMRLMFSCLRAIVFWSPVSEISFLYINSNINAQIVHNNLWRMIVGGWGRAPARDSRCFHWPIERSKGAPVQRVHFLCIVRSSCRNEIIFHRCSCIQVYAALYVHPGSGKILSLSLSLPLSLSLWVVVGGSYPFPSRTGGHHGSRQTELPDTVWYDGHVAERCRYNLYSQLGTRRFADGTEG